MAAIKENNKDLLTFLCGTSLLLISQPVLFKVQRAYISEKDYSFLDWILVTKSEFLLGIALSVIFYSTITAFRSITTRKIVLIKYSLILYLVLFIESSAHWYYKYTFEPYFSSEMLFEAFKNSSDSSRVILGTIPQHDLYTYLSILVVNFVIIVLLLKSRPLKSVDIFTTRKQLIAGYIFGSTCLVISTLPTASEPDLLFSRAASINFAATNSSPYSETEITDELLELHRSSFLTAKHSEVQTRKNLALIILESTRSMSTSLENQSADTTPFLRSLADQSLYVNNTYAVVPHTSKSLVSIICGVEPNLWTPITEALPHGIPVNCLPHLLREHGYNSVFFQSATKHFENRPTLVDNMGYQHFYSMDDMPNEGYETVNYLGREDKIMLNPSRAWLADSKSPFFATYLTVVTHHQYGTPSTHKLKPFSRNKHLNAYLNAINYQDKFIASLIQQYKDLGLYENTVFIITGDHGEGFGEHGRYAHNSNIYNEGLKVPLIIHHKDLPKQRTTISKQTTLLDILPTSAELLGFRINRSVYTGQSIYANKEERMIYASCWQNYTCLSVIDSNLKYIHHYQRKPDELFNIKADPKEQLNIIDTNKEAANKLKMMAITWRRRIINTYEHHRNTTAR